ncbi:MAG TPA: DUF4340 domain-containing protein [Blastocatellia bacterium]|jgi:hypothetical protein|nr:DUF4340 domain-containing protein [Blastocatellia bacterium]
MKRSTLIILLIAAVAGVAVYFVEVKSGKSRDEEAEKTNPAFKFKREDITGIKVIRGGQTINLENQNNKWVITQPVNATADEGVVNSLVGDLVSARIERDFAPAGGDLKQYGLSEPAVKLEVKLKSGETHRVDLGSNDEISLSAYAKIDNSQNVALLPVSLLNDSNKSLNDIRDRSVLGATQYELSSVKFVNESGGFEIEKKESEWNIKSPVAGLADDGQVSSLLADITGAKAVEVVSENVDDPAKYGLDKSKVSITARLTGGGERTVSIGSKVDENYYAKVSDRPQLLKIDTLFYNKLNTKVASLRSKQFVKLNRDELTKIYIKNANLTLVAEKKDNKWMVTEPADKKDKEASTFKIFTPLETQATDVLDKPSGAVTAKLAKPAVEVRLTDKNGKTTTLKISSADGDNVYVKVDGRPEIYKVEKSVLDGLNFKADEAVN